MIGAAPPSVITGVPGWESEDEQKLLQELAREVPKGGVIVEIGSEYGMSASIFASSSEKDVVVYAIDPQENWEPFRSNLKEANIPAKSVVIIPTNSKDAFKLFREETKKGADLVFIDGDHTFEGVQLDIDVWAPIVKKDGRLVFHDCACSTNKLPHPLHFEVTKAVLEWFNGEGADNGWELEKTVDSTMVFLRK